MLRLASSETFLVLAGTCPYDSTRVTHKRVLERYAFRTIYSRSRGAQKRIRLACREGHVYRVDYVRNEFDTSLREVSVFLTRDPFFGRFRQDIISESRSSMTMCDVCGSTDARPRVPRANRGARVTIYRCDPCWALVRDDLRRRYET